MLLLVILVRSVELYFLLNSMASSSGAELSISTNQRPLPSVFDMTWRTPLADSGRVRFNPGRKGHRFQIIQTRCRARIDEIISPVEVERIAACDALPGGIGAVRAAQIAQRSRVAVPRGVSGGLAAAFVKFPMGDQSRYIRRRYDPAVVVARHRRRRYPGSSPGPLRRYPNRRPWM